MNYYETFIWGFFYTTFGDCLGDMTYPFPPFPLGALLNSSGNDGIELGNELCIEVAMFIDVGVRYFIDANGDDGRFIEFDDIMQGYPCFFDIAGNEGSFIDFIENRLMLLGLLDGMELG